MPQNGPRDARVNLNETVVLLQKRLNKAIDVISYFPLCLALNMTEMQNMIAFHT